MNLIRRAGLTGLSAAMTLLAALPAMPAAAASSYDIAISDASQTEGSSLDFTVNVTWAGAHHPAFSVAYTTVAVWRVCRTSTTAGVLGIARDATNAAISVPTVRTTSSADKTFSVVLDPPARP
jgi:hypothetical protein